MPTAGACRCSSTAVLERDRLGSAARRSHGGLRRQPAPRVRARAACGPRNEPRSPRPTSRLLAQTLQQSFIPPTPPDIPGLELAAAYRPAGDGSEIGGDFYDVFEISVRRLVRGDRRRVRQGRGRCGGHRRWLATPFAPPPSGRPSRPRRLETLNEVLLHHDTDRFCTLAVLRLRRQDAGWSATVSCGGHPLPYLVRAEGSPCAFGRPGSLVGVLETPSFSDVAAELGPGDSLVVYTDGITEGRNAEDGFFGEARLAASLSLNRGSASALTEALLDEVLRFQSGHPRDDIAIVTITVP